VNSALTSDGDPTQVHPDKPNLPASFVPNRNSIFITLAHTYAQKIGAHILIGGMCQTDYSGYPDCKREYIDKIIFALNVGSNSDIVMFTPIMYINKAETFELAEISGVLSIVLKYSRTCYNNSDIMNDWGYGCGECLACKLRKKGWDGYNANSRR
ncbi:MAG: 7-cyano-7-deazaguanine synthase, partial [Bacteroidetes bacterium]|nr:7-cyano-7-deazaguanine synthase [Bacteroidota bacterium]